jgi:hypothetical protein
MRTGLFIFILMVLAAALGGVRPLPRECNFVISLDMPPPIVTQQNTFYTSLRGNMAHEKLYAHSFFYVVGGYASATFTGLGFDCPDESYFTIENDTPGETVWLFCELRCTECNHEARACIERPIIRGELPE